MDLINILTFDVLLWSLCMFFIRPLKVEGVDRWRLCPREADWGGGGGVRVEIYTLEF